MSLVHLPEDILLYIASFLSIPDILSLKQCCRVLHTFGSIDYLWHRLIEKLDLPLEFSPEVPIVSKSAEELQRTAIKAMQLEHNWRRQVSKIRKLRRIQEGSDELFVNMQLLPGGRWLFTANRYRRLLMTRYTTRVSVWWLGDNDNARTILNVEVTANLRTSTFAYHNGIEQGIVVLALHEDSREYLEIHTVPLQEDLEITQSYSTPSAGRQIQLPRHPRPGPQVVQELVLVGNLLAAIIAICPEAGGVLFQILFVDLNTSHTYWVHPQFTENFGLLQLRIQNGLIYLFDHKGNALSIRVYRLPSKTQLEDHNGTEMDDPSYIDLGPVLSQYGHEIPRELSGSDDMLHIPLCFQSSIPIAMFHVTGRVGSVGAYIAYVSVQNSEGAILSEHAPHRFQFRIGTAQNFVNIGTTGRRMVWLEHELETGRNRVMKLLFPSGSQDSLSYGVLLPYEPNLPFTLSSCSVLAFDEASGRLCLGFYDGSIHVLDFS